MTNVFDPTLTLEQVKRIYVEGALKHHDGNKRAAARALGVTPRSIYFWIEEFNLVEFKPLVQMRKTWTAEDFKKAWDESGHDKGVLARNLKCSKFTVYKHLAKHNLIVTKSKTYGKGAA